MVTCSYRNSIVGSVFKTLCFRTQIIADSNGAIPERDVDPELWLRVAAELSVGDSVTGTVVSKQHFGVFIDIGFGSGASGLLLVPEFRDAHIIRYTLENYPNVGDVVTALVRGICTERHAISLTQRQSFDAETQSWTNPQREGL